MPPVVRSRLARELAPRQFSELSEPDKLHRLWGVLPGYVAATARREGITPQRVPEILSERLPDDETWYGELAEYDRTVASSLREEAP